MLLDHHRPDVTVAGIHNAARKKFTVEVNSMMFRAAIDGIYSDKIRAPVRELLTNAWDGHKAAGREHLPFDVQLPTTLEPNFRVRDYGIGLSDDDVMGLYTTLYASSKRTSNDAVGMLGLGSKSPFAYTNSFTVTSWFDGVKSVYTCFLGADDVPEIIKIHSELSTESTGVEVQFSVKMGDLKAFENAAAYVFAGFDPRPNLLNTSIKINYPKTIVEGKGWKVVDDSLGCRARQGCVIYPIDVTAITGSTNSWSQSKVYNLSVIMDFPIGSLSVATSREALGNDEKTRNAVKLRIKEIELEATAKLQAKIDGCATFLDACKMRHSERPYGSLDGILWDNYGSSLKWKGRDLVYQFEMRESAQIAEGVQITTISPKVMSSAFPSPTFNGPKGLYVRLENLTKTLFVYDDTSTFSLSRMRSVILEKRGTYKTIVWVRGINFQKVLDHFENPDHLKLSDITPVKVTREKRAEVRKMPTTLWVGSQAHNAQELLLSRGGLYVNKSNDNFYTFGAQSFSYYPMSEHLRLLKSAGVLTSGQEVWNFTSRHDKYRADAGWTDLETYVKDKLPSLLNTKNYLAQQSLADLPRDQTVQFLERHADVKWTPDIQAFLQAFRKTKSTTVSTSSDVLQLYEIYFPGELAKLQAAAHPLLSEIVGIKSKYPMLPVLAELSYYNKLKADGIDAVTHYLNII